jgi:DNA-binding MarR family transcriptional regulator
MALARGHKEAMSFSLDASLLHLLHRASQAADDAFERSDPAVTARQFVVLQAVSQSQGCSQTELVAMTGVDRSTMADVMRRLQKRGFLRRRRRKDDERAYVINLTDRGADIVRDGRHAADSAERLLDNALGDGVRPRLCELLAITVKAYHEQRTILASSGRSGDRA